MKLKNTQPQINITTTNQIKYSGVVPDCALTGDCSIDESNLTYLISILLQRYCEQNAIIDADLSSIDLTCLIESNMDIELPEDITIETLATYYKNHFCAIYEKISDIENVLDSLYGINCYNDIVQLDQNDSIEIDVLFNDIIDEVSGTPLVTIETNAINGTATVSSNKINYTPDEDFFGNDQITYKVTKGAYECTAKISIKVNEVISTQSITDIVIEQITTILESDEYWDVGIPIGTKLSIIEAQLSNFNLVGGSWGVGSGKFAKWAICNGNNGTDDYKGLTTRGYNVNDSDYDDASSTNSSGSDSITLTKSNIPPHRHGYGDMYMQENTGNPSDFTTAMDREFGSNTNVSHPDGELGAVDEGAPAGSNKGVYINFANTGNGTDNINNQDELLTSPNAVNIRNKYFTEIMIQKIL